MATRLLTSAGGEYTRRLLEGRGGHGKRKLTIAAGGCHCAEWG